jgi:hypothetical protein
MPMSLERQVHGQSLRLRRAKRKMVMASTAVAARRRHAAPVNSAEAFRQTEGESHEFRYAIHQLRPLQKPVPGRGRARAAMACERKSIFL